MIRTIRIHHVCIGVAALLASASCGTEARSVPQSRAEHAGRPPVAVDVATVVAADITEAVEVVGSLAPKFVADVKSEVTGTVTAVNVTEWLPVRKGAPLARLDTAETEAATAVLNAVAAQARVLETRARREHDRALELARYGLITPQALDEAAFALDAATAATAAAEAQVRTAEARLAKSFIRSPMDGVVALRRVSVGDRVENMGGGDPMFRIVDNRVLELTVSVPSSRASDIRVGQRLEFTADPTSDAILTGSVMFINPAIEEGSRSVKVVATVPNGDNRLKGGLFVRGRIVTAVRRQVLQVPREALLDWNVAGRRAALFAIVDTHAEKRAVTTGAATDQMVEIATGLASGDRVVTRGAFALRRGDAVIVANGNTGS